MKMTNHRRSRCSCSGR